WCGRRQPRSSQTGKSQASLSRARDRGFRSPNPGPRSPDRAPREVVDDHLFAVLHAGILGAGEELRVDQLLVRRRQLPLELRGVVVSGETQVLVRQVAQALAEDGLAVSHLGIQVAIQGLADRALE